MPPYARTPDAGFAYMESYPLEQFDAVPVLDPNFAYLGARHQATTAARYDEVKCDYLSTVVQYSDVEAQTDPIQATKTIREAYNYFTENRGMFETSYHEKKFNERIKDLQEQSKKLDELVKATFIELDAYTKAVCDGKNPKLDEAAAAVVRAKSTTPEKVDGTRLTPVTASAPASRIIIQRPIRNPNPKRSMPVKVIDLVEAMVNNSFEAVPEKVAKAVANNYTELQRRAADRDYTASEPVLVFDPELLKQSFMEVCGKLDVDRLKRGTAVAAASAIAIGALAAGITPNSSHEAKPGSISTDISYGLGHANHAPVITLASANTDLAKAFEGTLKVTQKVAVEYLKSANQYITELTKHITPLSEAEPAAKPIIDHIKTSLIALQTQLKTDSPHGSHDLGDQQIRTAQLFVEYPSQFKKAARIAIEQQLSPADLQAAAEMQVTIFNGQTEFPVDDQATLSQLLVLIPDTFKTPAITVAPAETTPTTIYLNARDVPTSPANPEVTMPLALSENQLNIIDHLQLEPSKKEFIKMAINDLLPLQTADIHVNLPVVLAQAISESGWGQSGLAREANNYFGMKAGSDWNGPVARFPTEEVIGGQRVKVMADFKKFDSLKASVQAYAEYIASRSYYDDASRNYKDSGLYLDGLLNKLNDDNSILIAQGSPGAMSYATDPSYKSTILSIIDHQNINELLSDTPPSAPVPAPTPPEHAPSTPLLEIPAAPEGTTDLGIHTGYHATKPYGDGSESDQIRLVAIPHFKSPTSSESQPGDPLYIDGANGNVIVNAKIAANVLALYKAAQADGIDLSAASSFRSMQHQQQLFSADSNRNEVAFPGRSNHQDGLAFDLNLGNGLRLHAPDFSTADGGDPTITNPRIAPTSAVWVWMIANGHKFGLRQFFNEPWHWELDPNADISASPSAQDSSSSHKQAQDN